MTSADYYFKFRVGTVLIGLGAIMVLVWVFLLPDSICLGALAFTLLFALGSLLLLSAGIDSAREWHGGNRNRTVLQVGLFVAWFFAYGLIKIFAPESLELYFIFAMFVIWIIVIYYFRKKSQPCK